MQAPLRRAGRRAPAGSGDLALRLLLRHSDWWDRLSAEDHELLHGLDGVHGEVVSWLERQLVEHGAQTWSALEEAARTEPWHSTARAWVEHADPDEEQQFADLQRVLHRLSAARLEEDAAALIAEGRTDREHLDRIGAIRRRIADQKAAEQALSREA